MSIEVTIVKFILVGLIEGGDTKKKKVIHFIGIIKYSKGNSDLRTIFVGLLSEKI